MTKFPDALIDEATEIALSSDAESVRIIHVLEATRRRLSAQGGGFYPAAAAENFSGMVTGSRAGKSTPAPPVSPRLERFIPEMESCGELTELVRLLMQKQDDREGTSLLAKSGVQGAIVTVTPGETRIENQRVQPHQVTILDRESGAQQTLHLNASGTYSPEP